MSKTVTTERTSKRYKAAGCLANIIIIAAAVWMFYLRQQHATSGEYKTPAIVLGVGVIMLAYARIGKWWNND